MTYRYWSNCTNCEYSKDDTKKQKKVISVYCMYDPMWLHISGDPDVLDTRFRAIHQDPAKHKCSHWLEKLD